MGLFSAKFLPITVNGRQEYLRLDTRLWLGQPIDDEPPRCLGAVVGLNPGSARPFGETTYGRTDPTMNFVLSSFRGAFAKLKHPIPKNSFVQMLNTFYLKEHDAELALSLKTDPVVGVIDPSEQSEFPFFWFAWGTLADFNDCKRFLARSEPCCWMDTDQNIHFEKPNGKIAVRHPLFSPREPRIEMISRMLDRYVTL